MMSYKLLVDTHLQPIRDWAAAKGIIFKGDPKTQTLKLMEEVGELSKAIIEKDKDGIADGLGDCVVVLVSIATLCGMRLEDCINLAYNEIKDRKGEMNTGTFIKHT